MVSAANYDRYGKRGLEGLLAPYGEAQADRTTAVSPHSIDLFFSPGPGVAQARQALGLLGELIQRPTVLEPFSTRPRLDRLSGCVLKLHSVWAELRTAALRRRTASRQSGEEPLTRQAQEAANDARRPGLVLFVPWATDRFVRRVCSSPVRWAGKASKVGLPGVYCTSSLHRTTLVVVDRLPEEARTLFVRLLFGRGETFLRAWKEFEAGYREQEVYRYLLKQARSYSILLEGQSALTRSQQEQKKEYRMLWSTLTYDYFQEHVDNMEAKIALLQGRMALLQGTVEQERSRVEQERAHAEQERRQALSDILLARFAGLNGELEPMVRALAALPLPEAVRKASGASLAELLELSSPSPAETLG